MFRSIVVVFLLLSSSLSFTQHRPGAVPPPRERDSIELSVRVVLDTSRPAGELLDVQLQTSSNMVVSEAFTSPRGDVLFSGLGPGLYRVKVKGTGIEETVSNSFEITSLERTNVQVVTVRRTSDAMAADNAAAGTVSASQLNVPAKARKEFDKGKELFDKGKNDEAAHHFTKAAEIYPQYAGAFDMLGVIASQSAPVQAKTYFRQAIAADKQYIPAAAHLAKVFVGEKDFTEAEPLLTRTLQISPQATEALFLLAYVQAKLAKCEDAIRTTDRLHQLDHKDLALVHFVAAGCYSSLHRPQEAVAQYELYLKEAPLGPSVEIAKKNISVLQAQQAAK